MVGYDNMAELHYCAVVSYLLGGKSQLDCQDENEVNYGVLEPAFTARVQQKNDIKVIFADICVQISIILWVHYVQLSYLKIQQTILLLVIDNFSWNKRFNWKKPNRLIWLLQIENIDTGELETEMEIMIKMKLHKKENCWFFTL